MKKFFSFLALATMLASCSKHYDGTSVWSDGLWILPVVTGLATLIFAALGYREHKTSGNTRYYGFALGTLIAFIVIVVVVNLDK